jgi:gliding motility-associated-like protein
MKLRLFMLITTLIIWTILLNGACKAQCKVSAPSTICIGNLGYFNVTIPVGSKISNVKWDFGDGYTAKFQNTGHLFKKTGTFNVKCKVTLNDNSTCSDSVKVKVLELPKADFEFEKLNTCLATNQICINNTSKPVNSSQNLVTNLVVWDDGSYSKIDSAGCHQYKQDGTYKITIEVTDNKGCKNLVGKEINIIPSPKAGFSIGKSNFCGQSKICFSNTSFIPKSLPTICIWQIDEGTSFQAKKDSQLCYTSFLQKDFKVKLIVSSTNGCSDTLIEIHHLNVDTISNIQMVLSDSSVCYKTKVTAKISPSGDYTYKWNFENKTTSAIEIDTRVKGKLGNNLLRCTVTKGNCKLILEENLLIKGPIAKIKIFNQEQCGYDSTVFFIDSSSVINSKKASRFWELEDTNGDSCISFRAKNINKYRNCNYSKDWYHKHKYSDTTLYHVTFFVYDSLTQCFDSIKSFVETNACSGNKKDGNCFTQTIFCQGDFVRVNPRSSIIPEMISLDNGKTWHKLPWRVTRNYKGIYFPMVAYNIDSTHVSNFGDDSIKVYIDSTISYTYLLLKTPIEIKETPNAKFNYTLSKGCSFKDILIQLEDTLVKAGDYLVIHWGDNSNSRYNANTDTVFDSIGHRYFKKLFYDSIQLYRYSSNGCMDGYKLPIKFGYQLSVDSLKNTCFGQEVCVNFSVTDFGTKEVWSELNGYGSVKFITGEGKLFENDFAPCFTDTLEGRKVITLITTSKDGCSDTVNREYYIGKVKAGVTQSSKYFGCGEIKQLFDSSTVVPLDSSNDVITDYIWEFEKANNTSIEKDPYHAFSKFGKFKINHKVITKNGCIDTVNFSVNVVGPQANFEIADTIGCEPFKVVFKNKTRNSTQYYWDFGDPEYNTYLNSDTSDVEFTYSTAGKYYIRLTGIDTFYSSTTQTLYYCNDTFPLILSSRSVTVLPFFHVAFNCNDTLCVNEELNITNNSDQRIITLNWDFGDGTKKSTLNDKTFKHTYKKVGSYQIELIPDIKKNTGLPLCFDTATKLITVKGSMANFEFKNLCNNSPLVQFINTTTPDTSTTKYHWFFGQPNLPNNESTEKNPKHDFGLNVGNYEVCLSVIDTFGCSDSVCVLLNNNYSTRLKIPNIFTPGFIDDKNDEFDIIMEGEEFYDLSIYNRWGLLMYHSAIDGERGDGSNWNGKVHNTGNECPEGTYFYILDYKNCYGDIERKRTSGAITLIR